MTTIKISVNTSNDLIICEGVTFAKANITEWRITHSGGEEVIPINEITGHEINVTE